MGRDGIDKIASTMTQENLDNIIRNYQIDLEYRPQLPPSGMPITSCTSSQIGIYHHFMMAGLRFPAFGFLEDVLRFYKLHICQIVPNGIRKIICFALLSRALNIPLDLDLFRYFYYLMSSGDWVAFSNRPKRQDLCEGTLDSIKHWKKDFFFVNVDVFSFKMTMGMTRNRQSDASPILTCDQEKNAATLAENYIIWSDPSELDLGMAILSPSWLKRKQRPVPRVDCIKVPLLRILQGKIPDGTAKVFTVDPNDSDDTETELPDDDVLVSLPSVRIVRGKVHHHTVRLVHKTLDKTSFKVKDTTKVRPRSTGKEDALKKRKLLSSFKPPIAIPQVTLQETDDVVIPDKPLFPHEQVVVKDEPEEPEENLSTFPPPPTPPVVVPAASDSDRVRALTDVLERELFGSFTDDQIFSSKLQDTSSYPTVGKQVQPDITDATLTQVLNLPQLNPSDDASGVNKDKETQVPTENIVDPHPVDKSLERISDSQAIENMKTYLLEGTRWVEEVMARAKHRFSTGTSLERQVDNLKRELSLKNNDIHLLNYDLEVLQDKYSQLESEKKLVEEERDKALELTEKAVAEMKQENEQLRKSVNKYEKRSLDSERKIVELQALLEKSHHAEEEVKSQGKLIEELNSIIVSDALEAKRLLESATADVEWLVRSGIPSTVVHLLRSEEYGKVNAVVQRACIEYGLHKGCAESLAKHAPGVAHSDLPYYYPNAREKILSDFAGLVRHKFTFLDDLRVGKISYQQLRSLFDSNSKPSKS